jgi:hypothetical protein
MPRRLIIKSRFRYLLALSFIYNLPINRLDIYILRRTKTLKKAVKNRKGFIIEVYQRYIIKQKMV